MNRARRVAVIGSGISGLSAAWLLRESVDVALLEIENRFGGHSHTFDIEESTRTVAVDTGFMVFNRPNYPLLSKLFDELGVQTYATDMSFSVSLDDGALEYAGSSLRGLFAQRRNLVRPGFLGMLQDILRFNGHVKRLVQDGPADYGPLGAFLDEFRFGWRFREHYLYPMAAAIWSCPRDAIADFPLISFARFFHNHGLVNLVGRPQWETLEGGASAYVGRMVSDLGNRAHTASGVRAVVRGSDCMTVVMQDGERRVFDDVVFACHSDQALSLFANATPSESAMLRSVGYQSNRVLLHSDQRLMPMRRAVWSSWNYLGDDSTVRDAVSVSYWMNSLQRLDTETDYFVSLNPLREPDVGKVIAEFDYRHPVFDASSQALPQKLARVQGRDRAWFCGAWTGYGFHEDGIRSGIDVAQRLGARIPWDDQLRASRSLAMGDLPWAVQPV